MKKKFFNFDKIILIPLLFIIIYSSGYCLSLTDNSLKNILLIFGTILLLLESSINRKINLMILIKVLVTLALIFLPMIFNADLKSLYSYVTFFFLIVFSVVFVDILSFEKFSSYYINVVIIITVISIIFFIANSFLHININYSIFVSYNGIKYKNFYNIYFQIYDSTKNISIFWEPGLFSSYIALAMILLVFQKNISLLKMIILIIGILTSGSTSGYVLIILVFLLRFSKNGDYKKNGTLTTIIIIFLVTMLFLNYNKIVDYLIGLNSEIFSKLLFDDVSSKTRIYSPIIDFKIYLKSPIFGFGINKFNLKYLEEIKGTFVDSQTSTIGFLLGSFGIFGLIYLYMLIRGVFKNLKFNFSTKFIIFTIVLFILNKEPHYSMLVSWIFVMYLNFHKIIGDNNER